MAEIPTYTKDKLPEGPFPEFRKKLTTRARRMDGPFQVITVHDSTPVRCEDGWLGIDHHGHPYPIAAAEFEAIYEPVDKDEAM